MEFDRQQFDQQWSELSNHLDEQNLSKKELEEISDENKLDDANAYYSHLAIIIRMWYHAKLGEHMGIILEPQIQNENHIYKI